MNKLPITSLVNLTTEELLKYAEDNVITELESVLFCHLTDVAIDFSELKDRYHKLETEYVDLDYEFSSLVKDLENCKEQL